MNDTPARKNPFPGLRPFTPEEDYLFFGREEQTIELLQRLGSNRFVAVVGASGSGKSSLVRCGLLSELLGGRLLEAGAAWEVAVTHPGGNPLGLLTDALLDADLYDRHEESARENLLATLSRSHFGLVEAVKQAGLAAGTNFLLVVDQFEEIFRFHEAGQTQQEAANEFVSLLLESATQKETSIYIVLTMRSDFIGECGQFEGLAEMVNRGEFLIPRLSREQFKRVIEGPIKVAGGQIAPRLLQRLLNDLGQQADQLPCLQHALMRTWNVWAGRNDSEALDLDDYHRVGRMSQALSLHADEIYEALADDRQRELCRGLFQALTFEEANSRGIRRPQRLGRLCQILEVSPAELRLIIDAYRQSGVTFLMPSPNVELTDQTIIDISHESLMRVWTRLRQWVEDETQAAGIYHRLSESADLHAQGKAGLYRDPELGIALAWRAARRLNAAWAERYRPGFVMAITFLEESQRASVAEGQAHEAARQRELQQAQQLAEAQQLRLDQQQRAARKMRTMIWGLAVVAIIAVVAMVVALVANNNATKLAGVAAEEATEAKRQRKLAQDAAGATQNALIQAQTNLTKAEKAELLARGAEQAARSAEEAGRKLLYTTDMRLAPFVWRDDRTTAEQLRVLLAKHVPEGKPTTAKPDLRGFEWHYYEHLRGHSAAIFVGHPIAVAGAAFAAKDRLVTLDQHGQVRRWNLDAQAEVKASRRELVDGEKSLLQVLSADGRLAALGMEKKIVVFDTVTGAERYRIDSASTLSRHILFTPGSDRLIIVDDRIRWCDAATGIESARINQGFKRGSSLATSADGRMLAVVGHGTLGGEFSSYRLDADSKKVTALAKDAATGGTLSAAAVSSDGRLVALGRKLSGQLSVFDMTTGKLVANHGSAHASPISAMAFSGSDFKLVTADSEGILKVWEDARKLSAKSAASMTLKGHDAAITHVGFSANGKHLVSTSLDKTARVWDLDHAGAAILPLQRIGINCSVARFSPDGQLIAAADSPSVKLWDAATGQVVRQFPADADERVRAYSVAFSPTDPRLLAVGYGGGPDISHVALWDIDSGTPLARLIGATDIPDLKRKDEYGGTVGALAFSPDGKYLVAGFGSPNVISPATYPNPVKVWEVATRRLVRRLQGHTGFCVSLAFSRDGKRLASGSRDGTAILWSTADWTVERTLRNPDTATIFGGRTLGMVDEVAFSPDGQTLAMTSREGSVVLWDVAGGKMLDTLKGHSSSVGAAVFSPDGRTLATGGGDQTVRLWNVDTRRQLLQMDAGNVAIGSVESLAFSPDGKHLLMAGRAGAAFWSATPMLWSDPGRAAAHLRGVLSSDADFASRMRMYSENLRLHEALAHLDAKDVRVQAAQAAARANWLAAQGEWKAATQEYDRLAKCSPIAPSAWLRTPGLIRVATALFHEGRSTQAASLLTGGARRRAMDGLPPQDADDFDDPATGELCDPLLAAIEARLAKNPRDAGVLELRAELAGQWSDTRAQLVDYTVAIDALAKQKSESADLRRLQGRRGIAYVRLERWKEAVADFARAITKETTDEELLTNQALALAGVLLQSPKHQSVLKIADAWVRLAAAYRVSNDQAAIDALVRRRPASIAAIGDLFAADRAWPRAVDIYSQGITDKTTDPLLLAKRARGHEALKKWDAAAVDWSRAAASDPDGATLLADFARRLAAAGQVAQAMRQFDKAQDRYERVLAADPSNDLVATDLTQLLLDRHEHSAAAIDRRGVHSAVLRISDPWLKLGAAYAANGNEDAASGYFTRTLHKNANATRHVVRDLTEVVLGPLLANAARAKLRGEMFEALKTELALYRKQLQSDRPDERAAALDAVHAWQTDDDLAVLRTPAALAGLPVDELKAFNQLWAELAELHFKGIAAAPADRQIVHVADWFTKLNPGFDGKLTHKSEGNVIASLEVHAPVVQDLSPLQALTGLRSFVGRPTLGYDNNAARDARLLRSLKTLETINGKPVAKFWQDAQTRQAEFNQWLLQVPKLSPKEQANAVLARLKERNPGSPCYVTHMAEGKVVTELWIHEAYKLTDISPVRALANLKSFKCDAGAGGDLADLTPLASLTKLNAVYVGSMKVRDLAALKDLPLTTLNLSGCNLVGDLSPLRGLPLITLELHLCTSVHDLTPLKGMPLTNLNLHDGPKVVDLAPLRGMQLTDLWLGGNRILDLSPLKGMPLKSMSLSHCVQLQDLSPLRGLPLETLYLDDTKVRDLAPLKNLPLKKLYVNTPGVTDLRPLQGIALEDIRLTAKNISHGLDMLRAMKSLQRIGTDHYQSWPTAEYWARFDKGEFKK